MEKKKINLKIWIPIAAVVLIIVISAIFLMTSSTTVAALNIEEGDVQVDTGKGWVAATDGMELSLDDKVRTAEGKAVVVLYESILIELDPNTEIAIEDLSKDHTKIRQSSGSTWNKFAAIAGIQSFEVETPNTVATVRGTDFWVDMESVGVSEGAVDVKMRNKVLKLTAGKKAVVEKELPVIKDINQEEVKQIVEKKKVIVNQLKDLRQKEIEKHSTTYNLVKTLRGWTDDDVKRYLERLDNGEFNENEIRQKIILPAETIEKFAKISREIKQQKEQIEQLETKSTAAFEQPFKTVTDETPTRQLTATRTLTEPIKEEAPAEETQQETIKPIIAPLDDKQVLTRQLATR